MDRFVFRPQRLVVCLVLFGLLGGAGTVFAGIDQQILPELPETFQVASPLHGDRGGYNVTLYVGADGGLRALNASAPAFEFVHKMRPWFVDGHMVQLEEVGELRDWGCSFNDKQVPGYESDLFLPNGTVIGNGRGCGHLDDPILSQSGGMDWRLASDQSSFALEHQPRIHAQFCGQRSRFQQEPVELDDLPSDLIGRCAIHYQPSFAAPNFKALGTAPYGAGTALVVEGMVGQAHHQRPMTWWFVPDLPYPVKWAYEGPDGALVVLELSWFIRGTPAPPLRDVELPPPRLEPWGKQGPEEDGDHLFPLSEAMAYMRGDPQYSALREFEASHPDAAVQEARVRDLRSGSARTVMWSFVLADGADYEGFSISRHTSSPCMPAGVGCLPVQGPPSHQYSDHVLRGATFPDAAELPQVPPVSYLYEVYSLLTGHTANMWGISSCKPSVCDGNGPYLMAGRSYENSSAQWNDGDVFFPSDRDHERLTDVVYFAPDGMPVAWKQGLTVQSYGPRAHHPDPPKTQVIDHKVGATLAGQQWAWTLSTGQTTGSLLAAALISGAVYLWPRVRRNGAGASEITRLLENPNRRKVLQAVHAEPGIHVHGLERATGLGMGTVRHHLERLERACLLRIVRSGRYACIFPMETTASEQTMAPLLCSPGGRAVAAVLSEDPQARPADVARRTGFAEGTVRYHLKRLRAQ